MVSAATCLLRIGIVMSVNFGKKKADAADDVAYEMNSQSYSGNLKVVGQHITNTPSVQIISDPNGDGSDAREVKTCTYVNTVTKKNIILKNVLDRYDNVGGSQEALMDVKRSKEDQMLALKERESHYMEQEEYLNLMENDLATKIAVLEGKMAALEQKRAEKQKLIHAIGEIKMEADELKRSYEQLAEKRRQDAYQPEAPILMDHSNSNQARPPSRNFSISDASEFSADYKNVNQTSTSQQYNRAGAYASRANQYDEPPSHPAPNPIASFGGSSPNENDEYLYKSPQAPIAAGGNAPGQTAAPKIIVRRRR